MSKADALSPAQINRVLNTCNLMQHSQARRCAIVLSHASMRVTEIALLQTKTILSPSGEVRSEIHLPASICKRLRPRSIWLSPKARAIIQEWIDYRHLRRWGVAGEREYQGLIADSRFLYSLRGAPYAIQPKRRQLAAGVREYWAADSLEQTIRETYKRCGLPAASSHTGRKSLCTNALVNGASIEAVARMLGHSSTETTLLYVVIQTDRIKEMCGIDWI